MNLARRIAGAINSVSAENGSNTPDFILANYLVSCLDAFDRAINARTEWFEPTTEEPASQNDPDGVGEGFEKALPDNAEQYSYDGVQWNSMEMYPLTTFNTPPTMFRRRIEPAEAPITRPAKAESIECIRGTTGCPINHYEDNGICVKPVREAKDARDASGTEPLREWVKDCYADELYVVRVSGTTQKFDVDHVREVSPELDQWHAELVRLLELEPDGDDAVGYWHWVCEILNHLAKRPQRGVK